MYHDSGKNFDGCLLPGRLEALQSGATLLDDGEPLAIHDGDTAP